MNEYKKNYNKIIMIVNLFRAKTAMKYYTKYSTVSCFSLLRDFPNLLNDFLFSSAFLLRVAALSFASFACLSASSKAFSSSLISSSSSSSSSLDELSTETAVTKKDT